MAKTSKAPRTPTAPSAAAPSAKRTPVGPMCLPGTGIVTTTGKGGWRPGSKGAAFVAAFVTGKATVAAVQAAAAAKGVSARASAAHLMWGYNHGWLHVPGCKVQPLCAVLAKGATNG